MVCCSVAVPADLDDGYMFWIKHAPSAEVGAKNIQLSALIRELLSVVEDVPAVIVNVPLEFSLPSKRADVAVASCLTCSLISG